MRDPLSAKELAAARACAEEAYWDEVSASYCLFLLDEIDRLRSKEQALTAAIVDLSRQRDHFLQGQTEEHRLVEQMRPIVEAVAAEHIRAIGAEDVYACDWCGASVPLSSTLAVADGDHGAAWRKARTDIKHDRECIALRARQIISPPTA